MIQIKTSKNYTISSLAYLASHSNGKTVVIASATGVSQYYYKAFAEFLCAKGHNVYTFDYQGIGSSLKGPIKKVKATATSWAKVDLEAVLNYCIKEHPTHSLTIMGHSIGGQILGLAPSCRHADQVILIASQSGYWKLWKGFGRLRMLTNWYFIFPLVTSLMGYFPGEKLSAMKNLPKGMAQEWRNWCVSKNYLFDHVPKEMLHFKDVRKSMTIYSVSDDVYAPKEAVDWLAARYSNATIERIHLLPKDLGQSKIGHFGFFKEKLQDSFWVSLLEKIS